jgi:hypothetical protein
MVICRHVDASDGYVDIGGGNKQSHEPQRFLTYVGMLTEISYKRVIISNKGYLGRREAFNRKIASTRLHTPVVMVPARRVQKIQKRECST